MVVVERFRERLVSGEGAKMAVVGLASGYGGGGAAVRWGGRGERNLRRRRERTKVEAKT